MCSLFVCMDIVQAPSYAYSTSLHHFLLHWLTTLPPAQQSVLRKKVFRHLKDVLTKQYFRDKYRWWMLVDFLRQAALISVIIIFPRSSVSIHTCSWLPGQLLSWMLHVHTYMNSRIHSSLVPAWRCMDEILPRVYICVHFIHFHAGARELCILRMYMYVTTSSVKAVCRWSKVKLQSSLSFTDCCTVCTILYVVCEKLQAFTFWLCGCLLPCRLPL